MAGSTDPGSHSTWVEVPGGQGVQVGDHSTQDNTFIGQYVGTQILPAQPAPVTWPVRVGDVPQMPPAFQPRKALLAALGSRSPVTPVVRAVTGMRGVGKTQVAAAYARSRMADGWRLVAWVSAGDMAQVLNGLGEVAARLGVSDPRGDLAGAAAAVRHWLEADGGQCLLVFDNAADLDGLRPFVPAAGDAQVVLTSSLQAASDLGLAVPVDVFSEEEALAFLADRTRSADTGGARGLAAELGCLPLALAQAAAVIARQRLGYATYLDRLRRLPAGEYLARVQAGPYPHGVAAAVLLSMDSAGARDSSGLHGAVLDLIAVLSTAGVSRALLYRAGAGGALGRATDAADAPVVVDAALAQLADASLLIFSGDGSSVSAHRLIMRVVRELRAREATLMAAGAAAARMLRAAADSLGPAWQDPGAARDLIQQVMALEEHLAPCLAGTDTGLVAELMSLRGWALARLNDLDDSPSQAIEYGQRLAADLEHVLGGDHPDTLSSRNNLAQAYRAAGRLGEAISLFEATLAGRERVLGRDHPGSLDSRNSLARTYRAAGRLAEAIPLFGATLADRERILGRDHADTVTSRGYLAYAYRSAGRLAEAIPLYEATHADFERILGASHPATLEARNNLAHAYLSAGRLDEAIPLYEASLTGREQVLGRDHPDTVVSRGNLARAYRSAGRLNEAIPLHERAHADFERILGRDHPYTMMSQYGLAAAYQAAGRLDEAIPLFERTLADHVRVLGHDNPDTMTSQNGLALAYQATGQFNKAIPLLEHALTDCERVLAADHPLTQTTRRNLAAAHTAK
jgi:tetratricopeptide (TPR) repeat protein